MLASENRLRKEVVVFREQDPEAKFDVQLVSNECRFQSEFFSVIVHETLLGGSILAVV
jgi:hypothetical protein